MATETPSAQITGYKETVSEGRSWVRCKSMQINNHMGGQPSVLFSEERVILIEGETIQRPDGELLEMFDSEGVIELFHPIYNTPMGQAPQAMVQVMLYSLYLQAARKRDARVAAEKTRSEEAVAHQMALAAEAAVVAAEAAAVPPTV